jgi:hypothetical protein
MRYHDLEVRDARNQWHAIRWALFMFPDIRDVQPTDDSDVVRIFYEGSRPYPNVWAVELAQQGFDLPIPTSNAAVPIRRAALAQAGRR